MKLTLPAVLALIVAAPAPAAPAKAPNRDVRCLMLSNLFAKAAPDAKGKEAAGQARLFYLGRVSSRFSQTQLESAMGAEASAIAPAKVGAEMNTCFASVRAAAAAIEAAGAKARRADAAAAPAGTAAPGR